ncbi:hypothetical protein AXF42_Ash016330 [Apostasia shenzhenica]|uniref:Helitron helicase-like domain-containing protein n=1 Tax=Apostasia shenzhenica TaxID=1088818 RepID=A0A2H9ZXI2_9ASPA|nr:hypothetical protein AXF42_Ash016330 [Apostasia shenzhenica]
MLIHLLSKNRYSIFFRSLRDVKANEKRTIILRTHFELDQRLYNTPTSSQIAGILLEQTSDPPTKGPPIVIYSSSGQSYKIQHYYGCYDPLQYPLLFPYGGKKHKIKNKKKTVSCIEYYCYKLQIRLAKNSILLKSGRLLQQFVVDMYIKIETGKLDFYRKEQKKIRADLYQGVVDSVALGERNASKIGKRIILPAGFIGNPRDLRKRYLDAMSLGQRYGKPDIFLTITCNPAWSEIVSELGINEIVQNRPDLTCRIFRAKLIELKDLIIKKKFFGPVAAFAYVVEFQKRDLSHAHFLIILKESSKITFAESYDEYVAAEIPDAKKHSLLFDLVLKHMMHGPYGEKNPKNVCMSKKGYCKSRYPKSYCEYTIQAEDSYPIYRRRNNQIQVKVRKSMLDNRWVVPYNPYLLCRFDCHLNVEVCSSICSVKYLYKYIYKGHDKIAFNLVDTEKPELFVDEIKQFQTGRWISPPEAMWRIYAFILNEMQPSVTTLQVHLPHKHAITFQESQDLQKILSFDFY